MNETRKLLRFDKPEHKIITETMKKYGMTYNGALGFIVRNWQEITKGYYSAKNTTPQPQGQVEQ